MSAPERQTEDAPEYQSAPLSPVSPKPIHLPAPSNIPILEFTETQMDQAYSNDNGSKELGTATQPAGEPAQNGGVSIHDSAAAAPHADTGDASGDDAVSAAVAAPTSIPQSEDVPTHAQEPPRPQEPDAPDAQTGQVNSLDGQSNGLFGVPDTGGVDIQAILDNLASSVSAPQGAGGVLFSPQGAAFDAAVAAAAVPATTEGQADLTSNVPVASALDASDSHQFSAQQGADGTDMQQSAQPSSASDADPLNAQHQPSAETPSSYSAEAAPGTHQSLSSLPPPPAATFQQDPSAAPQDNDNAPRKSVDDGRNADENMQWGADVQKRYDEFLQDERRYVLEGKWENFPAGSRLFIGNLPTERVTKRDLFHVFHKHGKLAQISIKQAYGFIQFLERDACHKAHVEEQNVAIRGKKVNLEISKPQRNAKGGNNSGRDRGNQSKGDRYVGTGARNRDRSPKSPHRRRRSADGRRRDRSRSRSPHRAHSPRSGQGAADDDASLALPHRPPHMVPELQIIAKDSPDRGFVQYVDSAFRNRGIRSDILLLSPKLNETAVVRRQIIEGVLAVMKLDHTNMASQKFGLSIFDRSAGSANVRFEEYGGLDLNICVELVLRARQTARPPQAPPQPPAAGLSQYGLPIVTPAPQSNGFGPVLSPTQPVGFQFPGASATPQSPAGVPFGGAGGIAGSLANVDPATLQQLLGSLQRVTPQPGQQGAPPQSAGGAGQWQQGRQPQQQQQSQQPPTPDILALLSQLGKSGTTPLGQPQPSSNQHQQQAQHQQTPSGSLPPSLASLLAAQANQPGTPAANTSQQGRQAQPGQPGPQQQQQPDMSAIMAQLSRYNGR